VSTRTGVVIHKMEGTDAEVWFANPAAGDSASYSVHFDGSVYQSVPDDNVAWHCGNWSYNVSHFGIEHAGWTAKADTTEAEYHASARLTAWMCVRWHIPIDRRHIIGHSEVPDPFHPGEFGGADHHTDPGVHWDWTHYIALVRGYAGSPAPAPSSPPSSSGGSSLPTGTMLSLGSRGSAVVALQKALAAHGFSPGPIDGDFGPMTLSAVRGFQASRHLTVDGIVGPHTWAALAR
jgi:N-acetyl-anhydromuramyl-L-alanine amidase AmpD